MWVLSGIGGYEAMALIAAVGMACCFGRRGLRWLRVVGPLLAVSAALPGPDLLGMVVLFALLMLAFAMGVRWASHPNPARGEAA